MANMGKGIYEEGVRIHAPYSIQAATKVYAPGEKEREPYLSHACCDVSSAFSGDLENGNRGRPIVLAGVSQGTDICCRLLEE